MKFVTASACERHRPDGAHLPLPCGGAQRLPDFLQNDVGNHQIMMSKSDSLPASLSDVGTRCTASLTLQRLLMSAPGGEVTAKEVSNYKGKEKIAMSRDGSQVDHCQCTSLSFGEAERATLAPSTQPRTPAARRIDNSREHQIN